MTALRSPRVTGLITAGVLFFLVTPLLIVVLFSFHRSTALSLPFEGFSLRWYREVFRSPEFRTAARTSVLLGVATATATAVLGTLAAYGVTQSRSRLKGFAPVVFMLPICLPALFNGIALLVLFTRMQVELSVVTIVIAHTVVAFPFFYIIASVALERLDPTIQEAAADLGASPLTVFRRITLPQVLPSLVGAAVLSFMVSLDEFVVTFFVSGSQSTLPLFVFSRLRLTLDPSINVVSTLLILLTTILGAVAFALNGLAERRRNQANGTGPIS